MSKKPLSIEELRTTTEYQRLTSCQREMIEAFVQHGCDRVVAYQAVHPTVKNRNSAAGAARKLFSMPAMVAVLNAYFQTDPLDAVKAEIKKAMQDKKITAARVQALKLYAAANGISIGTAAESTETPESEGTVVQDRVVERDGRKYRQVVTDLGPSENS